MAQCQSIFVRVLVWLLLSQRVLSVEVLLLPLTWLQPRLYFFFQREEDECHTKFVPETLRVPGVTKHLVHRRDTSPCYWVTSTFQQRSCERFRCRTRQQTAPPSVVRDLGARLEDFRCRLRLVLCQTLHESLRFSRPSSAHFACNDHHPSSSSCPTQFRVPVLLPLPSVPQNHSIGCVCFPQRRSISMVRRHQCRVQSQLHSSKERQTFCNTSNLRESEFLCAIQVSPHYVGGAETAGEGQRQTEAAQQQHPERLRINSHDSIHWECCEWDGRHRTTLGSD